MTIRLVCFSFPIFMYCVTARICSGFSLHSVVLCCYCRALEPSDVTSRLRVTVCSSDSSGWVTVTVISFAIIKFVESVTSRFLVACLNRTESFRSRAERSRPISYVEPVQTSDPEYAARPTNMRKSKNCSQRERESLISCRSSGLHVCFYSWPLIADCVQGFGEAWDDVVPCKKSSAQTGYIFPSTG